MFCPIWDHKIDCLYYAQSGDLLFRREDFLTRRPGALDKSIGHLLLSHLEDIAYQRLRPAHTLSAGTEGALVTLVENKGGLIDFLDDAFSPLNNGFKVIDYNDGLKKEDFTDNEIFMVSPCFLIEEEVFEGMGAREGNRWIGENTC